MIWEVVVRKDSMLDIHIVLPVPGPPITGQCVPAAGHHGPGPPGAAEGGGAEGGAAGGARARPAGARHQGQPRPHRPHQPGNPAQPQPGTSPP